MSTHLTIRDLRRLRQIVTVLVEEGFSVLVEELQLGWLTPLRCRVRCWFRREATCYPMAMGYGAVAKEFPVRLRRTLERLGPTFVKFGQMLSLRPDLLPAAYALELRKLQDSVSPLSVNTIRGQVEAELGKPIAKVFTHFDREPQGSASLAQVHGATLHNGIHVAVKVLRPGVREIVERDIHILLILAELAETHVAALRRFRPLDTVREFSVWTTRELDLTREAQHIDRFREMFAEDSSVFIPEVFWDLTTAKVLTMSFCGGIRADDHAALHRHHIDIRAVARTGIRAALIQFFEVGFFHADPHPGNFVIRNDGVLCFYDFGIVGRLDEKIRGQILRALISFAEHDTDRYLDGVLALADVSSDADVHAFRAAAREAIEDLYVPHEHRKRFTSALHGVVERASRYGIRFPADFVLLGKALMTMEGSALVLDPKLDIEAEMVPFLKEILAREVRPTRVAQRLQETAADWASLLAALPERTRQLLNRIERGEIGVKLNLQELQDFKHELDRQNDLRVTAVIVVAVLVASAVLLRLDASMAVVGLGIGKVGMVVGGVLLLWVVRLLMRRS